MYTPEQQQVLRKFDEMCAQRGISIAEGSRLVGISEPVMSALRKGSYKGRLDIQLAKLESYFKIKEEAAALPAAGPRVYVPTSTSTQVYQVIRNCQLKGGLAIACGDAGIGKTMAARRFVEDHPHDAIYIELNPCLTSLKGLLKHLCGKVGASQHGALDDLWLGLEQKLRDGMVVIVDEAQFIQFRPLEALRALTDSFAERGQTLGIVFVGNRETRRSVNGSADAAGFDQLRNRTRPRKTYKAADTRREDILLLFPDLAGRDLEIDLLMKIACSKSAIRAAVNLYAMAADNENTGYAGLVAMAKEMQIEI